MDTERTDNSPYLPATSPDWALYYKKAREQRRRGQGQHARMQTETKRRRRRANLVMALSTAALLAVILGFCAVFGP